jgi:hypothetical protein
MLDLAILANPMLSLIILSELADNRSGVIPVTAARVSGSNS